MDQFTPRGGPRHNYKKKILKATSGATQSQRAMIAWGALVVLVLFISYEMYAIQKPREVTGKSPAKSEASASRPADSQPQVKLKVTAATLNMRSSPEIKDDNIIGQLSDGAVLSIVKKDGDWYRVKDKDGKEGYVTASNDFVEEFK